MSVAVYSTSSCPSDENIAVRVVEGKRGLKRICIGLVSGLEAGKNQYRPRYQALVLSIGINWSWCASRIWMMGGGAKIYHGKRLGRSGDSV